MCGVWLWRGGVNLCQLRGANLSHTLIHTDDTANVWAQDKHNFDAKPLNTRFISAKYLQKRPVNRLKRFTGRLIQYVTASERLHQYC